MTVEQRTSDEARVRSTLAMSNRHRDLYGKNVPCTDLDFFYVDYDRQRPVACFEEKYAGLSDLGKGGRADADKANLLALSRLNLPVFLTRWDDGWAREVWPLNGQAEDACCKVARTAMPDPTWRLTEYQFVRFLHRLRGRNPAHESTVRWKDLSTATWAGPPWTSDDLLREVLATAKSDAAHDMDDIEWRLAAGVREGLGAEFADVLRRAVVGIKACGVDVDVASIEAVALALSSSSSNGDNPQNGASHV